MLGFTRTYYQVRPNPYVALKREDLHLHFFGMPDFKPEDSYGSCLVIVPDTGELFRAFAAGMRAAHGKLLVSGIPRMTRPRKRKNADNLSGFSVIDPGGNWIRIMASKAEPEDRDAAPGRCACSRTPWSWATPTASTTGPPRSSTTLSNVNGDTASAADMVEALAYRAELAVRTGDNAAAADALDRKPARSR